MIRWLNPLTSSVKGEKTMKSTQKIFLTIIVFCCLGLMVLPQAMAANAKFDAENLPDMSDCDPNNPVVPTGDTIKIALVASFSGPAASAGEAYFSAVNWAVHDINKRGGIMVDGKKKKIEVIKANHESKPDIAKKVCERMVLQEKVKILMGTNGSNIMQIINQVADQYKVIAMNFIALSDELMDAKNFSRYAFMTCYSTSQIGRTAAYYYGQIRKKEKKFYVLCQDYLFGHSLAEGFLKGMKEYYPDGQIVGEDYHKLFLTDFAPFLTKIKASGADAIYTGDWNPDAMNLLRQARQMGITLPIIHLFIEDPVALSQVGVEGSKGLVQVDQLNQEGPAFAKEGFWKYCKAWNDQWKTWKAPYNTLTYKWPIGANVGMTAQLTYWLLSVIERAGSTDAEKIIKVWEGDSYEMVNGKVISMRACDHKAVQDLFLVHYVPPEEQKQSFNKSPYYWFQEVSYAGPVGKVPAAKILPLIDPKLERCK